MIRNVRREEGWEDNGGEGWQGGTKKTILLGAIILRHAAKKGFSPGQSRIPRWKSVYPSSVLADSPEQLNTNLSLL